MIRPNEPRAGYVLASDQLRRHKTDRKAFTSLLRRPITVVLDRVRHNYNIGAIFRLCDAFLVERLVIGGAKVDLHKRRLLQAAQGTQKWVPWMEVTDAAQAVLSAKAAGAYIVVAEQTDASVTPQELRPRFPVCLVLGAEHGGISQNIVDMADCSVSIPMLGMVNSINVSTAAAIIMHQLSVRIDGSGNS